MGCGMRMRMGSRVDGMERTTNKKRDKKRKKKKKKQKKQCNGNATLASMPNELHSQSTKPNQPASEEKNLKRHSSIIIHRVVSWSCATHHWCVSVVHTARTRRRAMPWAQMISSTTPIQSDINHRLATRFLSLPSSSTTSIASCPV